MLACEVRDGELSLSRRKKTIGIATHRRVAPGRGTKEVLSIVGSALALVRCCVAKCDLQRIGETRYPTFRFRLHWQGAH